ncbi:MAG: enoyl-CoA hydratase/isomerase family protein [Alphaproteobacteria bacterium]|nr:enoyl-CoA hydratase/isomerase family protein [Alphaproteobacteria bacterium]
MIGKVAVIGAGVMGAGIAAHVANAGVPVVLLDIVPKDAANRSALAEGAVERMVKMDSSPFMSKAAAKLVTAGNLEDHLDLLRDCDWIIEAVLERLDVKQALYARLEGVRKPGCIVSSNTSTIPLAELTKAASPEFARHFLIAHFFNPPRQMRLLEVVAGPATSLAALEEVTRFADVRLGKSVVPCKDRPGFIGNRLGIYWLQVAMAEAVRLGLTVEEADLVMGKPFGFPKTGVFGLVDLIGLDLMPHINASMMGLLAKDDPYQAHGASLPLVQRMIAGGFTGRKGKGGFYRLNRDKGKRMEAVDLATGDYRDVQKPQSAALATAGKSLAQLLSHDSAHGRFAWAVMGRVLAYAAALVGEVSDSAADIDEAMRQGFGWKFGPFELIDQIGSGWLAARLAQEGMSVPPFLAKAAGRPIYRIEKFTRQALALDGAYHTLARPEGVLLLEDIKLRSTPLIKNASAAVWDVGDGVACLEFTTKMNALDAGTMELIPQAIALVQKSFKALVIYNEGPHFSAGANLSFFAACAKAGVLKPVEDVIAAGQQAFLALKHAPFPVVAAPAGLALGGGCEVLLAADGVQAFAETNAGLVEVGVGLIPGWGGCKEMLARWTALAGADAGMIKAFEMIAAARVSKSAAEAQEMQVLRHTDGVTMNRDRLLADAKAKALALVPGYQPPPRLRFAVPGPEGFAVLEQRLNEWKAAGKATDHDMVVLRALARVLSGGDNPATLSEQEMLDLERACFMGLMREPGTLARITHMLDTGKPLRN